jgi:hypothetical protein
MKRFSPKWKGFAKMTVFSRYNRAAEKVKNYLPPLLRRNI